MKRIHLLFAISIIVILFFGLSNVNAVDSSKWKTITVDGTEFKIPPEYENGNFIGENKGYCKDSHFYFDMWSYKNDSHQEFHDFGYALTSNNLKNIQMDHIGNHDVIIMSRYYSHWDYADYYIEIWEVMTELKKEGLVRYIGVSNFHECHIESLIKATGVCPEINESYASPVGTKQKLIDYCEKKDCQFITYSPLMDVVTGRISKENLLPIMKKYEKSLAQIVIRWNVDRGCIPLPKSRKTNRLAENFDVLDFQLTSEEIEMINGLNYDYQYLVESLICAGI